MFRKLTAGFIALLWSAMALAAVDVNKASATDLDTIKGIGPAIAARIIEERKTAPFKDWPDFISRVKGVGDSTAAKYSAEGLTVNGAAYKAGHAASAAPAAAAAKSGSNAKDAAAKPAKDAAAKPAAPAKAGGAS